LFVASDELEERVSALEEQVRDLKGRVVSTERDATAARVLAGGADRHVSEIRTEIRDFRQATTASFNALRADFVDLREYVDRGFAEMRGRFDATAAGQQQIVELIQTVIDDRRHG
jgi:predicted fused transcriptional regulator/phosphomethylpyrimidine kinase